MKKIGWQNSMIDVSKNIQAKYFRFFFQGPGIVLPTLGLELFPTELRGFVISSGTVAWALSLSIIPVVAFLLRHVTWRYMMGAAAVFGIHSFFTKWYCQQPNLYFLKIITVFSWKLNNYKIIVQCSELCLNRSIPN